MLETNRLRFTSRAVAVSSIKMYLYTLEDLLFTWIPDLFDDFCVGFKFKSDKHPLDDGLKKQIDLINWSEYSWNKICINKYADETEANVPDHECFTGEGHVEEFF